MKNFLLNNFSHDHLYRPLNAQIEITMRCNARCVFCSIWQKDFQRELTGEMTTDEIKHVLDELNRLGVLVVSFTGGEPTLRKDLPELVQYCADLGMSPSLATNGFFLADLLRKGKLRDISWIMVSLDWPDAERHDKYRKIQVFDKAVEGLKIARKFGKQALISTVVTKENLPYMEEMCKFAKNIDCMIELLPCEDLIREQDEQAHVVEEIESYIPDLHGWAKELRRLEKIYPNLTTDSVTASIIEAGGFGNQNLLHCVIAQSYLTVHYNGEVVFPCKIHPVLSVNIKNRSLYDVYYSKEVKAIIDKRDTFPFCKGCRFGCAIVTSIPTRLATLYQKYIKMWLKGNLF